MFKFIHTSDLHLGAKLTWLRENGKQQRANLLATFEKIIKTAIQEKVNVVFISGDLFDSSNPDKTLSALVRTKILELEQNQIHAFILPGNHDYYGENSEYRNWQNTEYTHIFTTGKPEVFKVENLGLTVYGQAIKIAKSHSKFTDLKQLFEQSEKAKINVCMFHGGYDIGQQKSEISAEEIATSGFDYIAMGDWHGCLDISNNGVQCWYPGSPEPIAIDQSNAGNILVGKIVGEEVTIEKQHIGKIEVLIDTFNMTPGTGEMNILKHLTDKANQSLAYKLTITGKKSLLKAYDLETILEQFRHKFFYLHIEDQADLELTEEELNKYPEELLVGRFISMVRKDLESEKDLIQKQLLEEVLQEGVKRLANVH